MQTPKHKLNHILPYPVDKEKGKARYDTAKEMLIVEVPAIKENLMEFLWQINLINSLLVEIVYSEETEELRVEHLDAVVCSLLHSFLHPKINNPPQITRKPNINRVITFILRTKNIW